MRLIVDTNVFISGIFFSGPPYDILNAWRHRTPGVIESRAGHFIRHPG
jgi:predicted nucleic acid-binding protein